VQYAISKIGLGAYLWGGNGPTRFDCSGLTSQAWKAAGVSIPRTSQAQLAGLPRVSRANIQPGDLVVWSFRSHADHVSIYTGPIGPGGADLVDTASSHPGGGVGWSSMNRRGGTIAGIVRPAPVSSTPSPKSPAAGTYSVKPGDTLSGIARTYRVKGGWKALHRMNKSKVHNPNLIYPGQKLRIR
jgi:LysM repeat protein